MRTELRCSSVVELSPVMNEALNKVQSPEPNKKEKEGEKRHEV